MMENWNRFLDEHLGQKRQGGRPAKSETGGRKAWTKEPKRHAGHTSENGTRKTGTR